MKLAKWAGEEGICIFHTNIKFKIDLSNICESISTLRVIIVGSIDVRLTEEWVNR